MPERRPGISSVARRLGRVTGDPRRLSGVAIVDPERRVRWLYRSRVLGDYPPIDASSMFSEGCPRPKTRELHADTIRRSPLRATLPFVPTSRDVRPSSAKTRPGTV